MVDFKSLCGGKAEDLMDEGFDGVCYGDYQTITLAKPERLLKEVERREDNETGGFKGRLQPLIDELKRVEKMKVWVNIG